MWCLDLGGICCEVHPTARAEDPAGTVRKFVTYYLAYNRRQILSIGQLSVHESVQCFGLSDQAWVSGVSFISNILAQVEAPRWGSLNNSNQNWGERLNDANSITNVAWGASVDASPTNLTRSPVNPCSAKRRVHENFFCRMHQEHL